jgi:hypothetical protein
MEIIYSRYGVKQAMVWIASCRNALNPLFTKRAAFTITNFKGFVKHSCVNNHIDTKHI